MASSNHATSGTFKIGGEEIKEIQYHHMYIQDNETVNAPDVSLGNNVSTAYNKCVALSPTHAFNYIAPPKFGSVDGSNSNNLPLASYLGVPENNPDFIKDQHVIGVMRNVDLYLSPAYQANIASGGN